MKPFPPKAPWNELYVRSGLKTLADRARRSDVSRRVRTAVGDLSTSIRTAAREKLPEAVSAAERFVKQMLTDDSRSPKAVINATGMIAPLGVSLPLAEAAIMAMSRAAAEFTLVADREGLATSSPVAQLLAELTGAEAALVLATPAAALMTAAAALADDGGVVIPKSQVGQVDDVPLDQLLASVGVWLHEIGTVDQLTAGECQAALTAEETAALLYGSAFDFEVVGNITAPNSSELFDIARRAGKPVLSYLARAHIRDFEMFATVKSPPLKVQDLLTAGADVVVFPGGRLLGGPPCGIIVGKQQLVSRIAEHALALACRVDRSTLAALEATISLLKDPVSTNAIPTEQLLSATEENLQHRAERIVAQLTACSVVASAKAERWPCFWNDARIKETDRLIWGWSILVTPKDLAPAELAERLKHGTPAVLTSVDLEESYVWIHLRSVLPRQDEQIVAVFRSLCAPSATPECPSASNS
jgi:L-seryl-tRNA(Ser) seleniumtransferase